MNQNPTLKALSSMQTHQVKCLLMGGQACVFYGAAEFSRDADLVVLADQENLHRLQLAMESLGARVIAVPPFLVGHLEKGHAVHFRCSSPGAEGLRVDVMAKMRNVNPFPLLWDQRTTLEIEGQEVSLLSLPDLVMAKKTQREKDWPMIRRLVEAHWFKHRQSPTLSRIDFWLTECRTPEILMNLAKAVPDRVLIMAQSDHQRAELWRDLVSGTGEVEITARLEEEKSREMAEDRAYWLPLKQELELMRRKMI